MNGAEIEEYYMNLVFENTFVGYSALEWVGLEGRFGLDRIEAKGDIHCMSVTLYVGEMEFSYSIEGGIITRVLMG